MKNHLQQLIEESERLKNLPSIPKELEAPYSLSSVLVVPDYNVPRLPRKVLV